MMTKEISRILIHGLFGVLVSIGFYGCSGIDPDSDEFQEGMNEISEIRYGTYFGMCAGYCLQSVEVTSTKIRYQTDGWFQKIQTISCESGIPQNDYASLIGMIGQAEFFNIPQTIGCPDCADGGAEWIEIISGGKRHKVTFEYMNEPDILTDLVSTLRTILESFDHCAP